VNLSPKQRDRIKYELDALVPRHHPNPSKACHTYSILGCIILNKLLGRLEFIPQGGARHVRIGDDPEGKPGAWATYSLDPGVLRRDGAGREVHYWIASRQGQVIDFTTCFVKAEAFSIGCRWDRDDLPSYVWDHAENVSKRHGLMLIPDRSLTESAVAELQRVQTAGIPADVTKVIGDLQTLFH
jgi:hypothetical protein